MSKNIFQLLYENIDKHKKQNPDCDKCKDLSHLKGKLVKYANVDTDYQQERK